MTEYELMDAFASCQSLFQGWTTTYFSGVTAYLVAAYLLGAKLNRSQALVVTACFVLYAALCLYAGHGTHARVLELASEIRALNPNRQFGVSPLTLWLSTTTGCIGVLISLKFMWDVRHPRTG